MPLDDETAEGRFEEETEKEQAEREGQDEGEKAGSWTPDDDEE